MKLKAMNTIYGLKKDPREATLAGETFTANKAHAQELLDAGCAEEFSDEEETDEPTAEELAAATKAELLGKIAAAQTFDEINALVTADEVDPEVFEAAHKRSKELEPHH